MLFRALRLALPLLTPFALVAAPLSKSVEVDFFRDVPSRSLKGFATRSDGRLVTGPTLEDLAGQTPADLLWALTPAGPQRWLAGSGPEGKIFELSLAGGAIQSKDYAKLTEPQVYALLALADGTVLAGTSPTGALYLIRDGQIVARTSLGADAVLDIVQADATSVLVATGNPGRLYRVALAPFAKAGVTTDATPDKAALAARGITLFGEVRDRNLRRLAVLSDGRVAAGSAPKGNLYVFPAAGGPPRVLQENRDAEVTDLLAGEDGGFYATITFASSAADTRVNRGRPAVVAPAPTAANTTPTPPPGGTPPAAAPTATPASTVPTPDDATPEPLRTERFAGRGQLVFFPADGFPEVILTRTNTAFYRLARLGERLLITGGEQGELIAYEPSARRSLTLTGSASAQLNALAPAGDGKWLLLRNNPAGFALLDPAAGNRARTAETRRIDLGGPTELGQIRIDRLRDIAPDAAPTLEIRTSFGSDEQEGWSEWTKVPAVPGGWFAPNLRARYVRLRVTLPVQPAAGLPEIDKATLFHLPQNRRPQLTDFRIAPPNFELNARTSDGGAGGIQTLGQLLGNDRDSDDRRTTANLTGSPVAPQPGMQIVYWAASDADGDNLAATFSLRREGTDTWTDVVIDSVAPYAQFDTRQLPDGVYFTRLVISEQAPRRAADRLSTTLEVDDLVIDHTPPEILEASARRDGKFVTVSLRGRDALSPLDGVVLAFNNGRTETLEQPEDNILDGREETFTISIPAEKLTSATAVELTLHDDAGNTTARRVPIK